MPAGTLVGKPRGTPAGSLTRRISVLRHRPQMISPSRPQPGHVGGNRTSSSRCIASGSASGLRVHLSASLRRLMIGPMRPEPSETVRRITPGNESWITFAILLIGGVVVGLIGLTTIMAAQHSAGWGYDFRAYYDAALRLLATGTPYQDQTLSGPFQPGPADLYLYTPIPALLVVPLTWL